MSKNPMMFFPYNYCFNCKTNSIEIYSWHNYAQKYAKVLDQFKLTGHVPDFLDRYGIYTMRCSRCGKEYKIDWSEGIPKPIIDNFEKDIFMEKFRQDSINGKPNIIDNIYEERIK